MNIENITYPAYFKDNSDSWFGLLSVDSAFRVFDGNTFNAIIHTSTRSTLASVSILTPCSKEEFEHHYECARAKTNFGWEAFFNTQPPKEVATATAYDEQ